LSRKCCSAAPLEDKFWANFCDAIGLSSELRNDRTDPRGTKEAVRRLIRSKTAAEWDRVFAGQDVCCSPMASLDEALRSAHFAERGVFKEALTAEGQTMPALSLPIAACLRGASQSTGYPTLGADNGLLEQKPL
jgi:alpha-methylacyl-CoA racemase